MIASTLVPDRPPTLRSALVALLLVAALAGPASAEMVVLTHGDVMKVASYRVEANEAVLGLPEGGVLRLPIDKVERVLDDEIVEPPKVAAAPRIELGFDGQTAPQTPYGELILATARRHDVNPHLIAAMIRAESAFDPAAVSHAGARGLMQLMPATAERFGVGVEELFDPIRNLEAGVAYLRWLIGRFGGELPLILAAYNAGEGVVDRYGGIPPYRETVGYVERVSGFLGL